MDRWTRAAVGDGYERGVTHSLLIVVHAAAGTVAFLAGMAARRRPAWFGVYFVSMVVMAGAVAAAVVVGWDAQPTGARLIFSGLLGLAAVMLWRADLARRLLVAGIFPSAAADGHVGFTLIGLADAFLVVTVANVGAPGAVVLAVAVGVAAAGHVLLGRGRQRVAAIAADRQLP